MTRRSEEAHHGAEFHMLRGVRESEREGGRERERREHGLKLEPHPQVPRGHHHHHHLGCQKESIRPPERELNA